MARASSVGRLHNVEAESLSTNVDKPEPVKLPHCGNLEIDVSAPAERRVRGRFRRFQPVSPEAGYQPAPEIMSPIGDTAPLDRSFAFQELAVRERLELVRHRLAARGIRGL
jgi:hypothetical protein